MLTTVLASMTLLLTPPPPRAPYIYVDGYALKFEVNARAGDGSTYVPIQPIFEKMGFVFDWHEWDSRQQTATITGSEYRLNLTVSFSTMVWGERIYAASVSTEKIHDPHHIPIHTCARSVMVIDDVLKMEPRDIASILLSMNIWAQWRRDPFTLYISTELEIPQNLPEWCAVVTRGDVEITSWGTRIVRYQRQVVSPLGMPFDEFVAGLCAMGGVIIGSRQDLVTYQVYFHGLRSGERPDTSESPIRRIYYISTSLYPYTTPIDFGDLLTMPRRHIPQYELLHTGRDNDWIYYVPNRGYHTTFMALRNMDDVYNFINSYGAVARRQSELAYFGDAFFDRYVLLLLAYTGPGSSIESMEFTRDTMYLYLNHYMPAIGGGWTRNQTYFMVAVDRKVYSHNLRIRHILPWGYRQDTEIALPPLPQRHLTTAIVLGSIATIAVAVTATGIATYRRRKRHSALPPPS